MTRLEAAAAEVASQGKHTLAHALIFAGPAGVGKFHVARWWATRLKCRESGCDGSQCSDCRQLAAGTHADVAVVTPDAESGSIKIETIRDLIHAMALRPLRPGPRIAIVSDAH